MPKPRNWKEINRQRFQLYMDVFEDINKILGDLEYRVYQLSEKARMDLHQVMEQKADLYKDLRKRK